MNKLELDPFRTMMAVNQLNQEVSDPELGRIVEQIGSKSVAERTEAARKLQQMGSFAIYRLVSLLKRDRRNRRHQTALGLTAGFSLVLLFITYFGVLWLDPFWAGVCIVSLLGLCSSGLSLVIMSARPRLSSNGVALALAQFEDLRTTGAFVDILLANRETYPIVATILTYRLPMLKASDATLLNAGQRKALLGVLQNGVPDREPDFFIAILKALEQIGDETAVGPVQHLANLSARSRHVERVRSAARECLPYLLAKVERLRVSQTLLRASGPVASHPAADGLLRPAAATLDAAPDQLLRADASDHMPPGRSLP